MPLWQIVFCWHIPKAYSTKNAFGAWKHPHILCLDKFNLKYIQLVHVFWVLCLFYQKSSLFHTAALLIVFPPKNLFPLSTHGCSPNDLTARVTPGMYWARSKHKLSLPITNLGLRRSEPGSGGNCPTMQSPSIQGRACGAKRQRISTLPRQKYIIRKRWFLQKLVSK